MSRKGIYNAQTQELYKSALLLYLQGYVTKDVAQMLFCTQQTAMAALKHFRKRYKCRTTVQLAYKIGAGEIIVNFNPGTIERNTGSIYEDHTRLEW